MRRSNHVSNLLLVQDSTGEGRFDDVGTAPLCISSMDTLNVGRERKKEEEEEGSYQAVQLVVNRERGPCLTGGGVIKKTTLRRHQLFPRSNYPCG